MEGSTESFSFLFNNLTSVMDGEHLNLSRKIWKSQVSRTNKNLNFPRGFSPFQLFKVVKDFDDVLFCALPFVFSAFLNDNVCFTSSKKLLV